jgi:20S proteasome subunit beta 6
MVADMETLHKLLITKIKVYKREHRREMTTESIAQLLSVTLYGRRFMPYYSFNLLCGITLDGAGAVYGYDAIGSYDCVSYGSQGSGQEMASPLLDNQFIGHNHLVKQLAQDKQSAEDTPKDIINSIAERDIYTGDAVEVVIIDKNGISFKREAIRRD